MANQPAFLRFTFRSERLWWGEDVTLKLRVEFCLTDLACALRWLWRQPFPGCNGKLLRIAQQGFHIGFVVAPNRFGTLIQHQILVTHFVSLARILPPDRPSLDGIGGDAELFRGLLRGEPDGDVDAACGTRGIGGLFHTNSFGGELPVVCARFRQSKGYLQKPKPVGGILRRARPCDLAIFVG